MDQHYNELLEASKLLLSQLDSCKRYEQGVGGMTLEAQVSRSVLIGVRAGWVEHFREVVYGY